MSRKIIISSRNSIEIDILMVSKRVLITIRNAFGNPQEERGGVGVVLPI